MQSIIPPTDIPAVPRFEPEPLEQTLPALREMTILFAPETPESRAVMDRLRSWDHGRLEAWPRCVGFATEAAMVDHNRALSLLPPGRNASTGEDIYCSSPSGACMDKVVGVTFGSLEVQQRPAPPHPVSYTIHTQQESAPRLDRWTTPAQNQADANLTSTVLSSDLLRSGFVMLEHALNEAIVSWQTDPAGRDLSAMRQSYIEVARFPRQEWHSKYGSDTSGSGMGLGFLVRLYLPLAFMTSVSLLIVGIVDEKEKKLKEGMRMMGLTDLAYWTSWVLSHGAMATVVVALSSLLVGWTGLFPLTGTW